MKKYILYYFIISQINSIISNPKCEENKNNCEKCHPLTNICIKCISDNYIPDKNGGCIGICIPGKNYCNECDNEANLCIKCLDMNYYPDKIGGCSYTNNCESSYNGTCLKCIDNFVLIGENNGIKLCKNKNNEDFKNCKKINNKNGLCSECNKGYYLNKGDFKCIEKENCGFSLLGECISCAEGYYLNKKNNKCERIDNSFYNCKQTIDGKNCDICNENYYIADDGQCSDTLMCSKTEKGKCKICNEGYILLENGACTKEPKCKNADKDTNLCNYCLEGYCLDNNNKKCISNIEYNKYQNCYKFQNNGCTECIFGFTVGEDLKCSTTINCAKSDNGTCLECSKYYYLGYDKKCTNIEHCIYSGNNYLLPCDECEDNYYLDFFDKICKYSIDDKFKNCKISSYMGYNCASCKKDYYINQGDSLCYSNKNETDIFYKCESSDFFGEKCEICENNYFLNDGDKKCSKIENCKFSENISKCIECREGYCLDLNKQKCVENDYIEKEDNKFYIACNITNEDGNSCEICLDGYEVGENGYCEDAKRCEEKKDGKCLKCKNDDFEDGKNYCANEVFGCISTVLQNCVRCDNILDLYSCTECEEGYEPNPFGVCYRVFN